MMIDLSELPELLDSRRNKRLEELKSFLVTGNALYLHKDNCFYEIQGIFLNGCDFCVSIERRSGCDHGNRSLLIATGECLNEESADCIDYVYAPRPKKGPNVFDVVWSR